MAEFCFVAGCATLAALLLFFTVEMLAICFVAGRGNRRAHNLGRRLAVNRSVKRL